MNRPMSDEVAELFSYATREPLVALGARSGALVLDRPAVEAIIPHREPFLFIDRVTLLDPEAGLIAAQYDLARSREIFAVHFPGHPLWPGVLHVEAIAQAGVLLYLSRPNVPELTNFSLTHILGARFIRPVVPGGDVEIIGRIVEDELFITMVGQCIHQGEIRSVVALKFFP